MRRLLLAICLTTFAAIGCTEKDGGQNAPVKDDWTHKEIAEHLNRKGVKVTVSPAPVFDKPGRTAAYLYEKIGEKEQRVLAYLCTDAKGAKEQAGTMGEGAFVLGRFAIGQGKDDGSEELLGRVQKALK